MSMRINAKSNDTERQCMYNRAARADRLRTLLGEISCGSSREKSAEAIVVKTPTERLEERRAEERRNGLST